MAEKKYANARFFRAAIRDRVKKVSRQTGIEHADIYRHVGFERFVVRMKGKEWIIKGGFSLATRLANARTTKDIDMSIKDPSLLLEVIQNRTSQSELIVEKIRALVKEDIGDFFTINVTIDKHLRGFGKGGVRCNVQVLLDDEQFTTFKIDVIVSEGTALELQTVEGTNFLEFAGLAGPVFLAPLLEEVFADKIHAYTRPRKRENTRVKDIIDMVLIIKTDIDKVKTKEALTTIFDTLDEHKLPSELEPPPHGWESEYDGLVGEIENFPDLQQAYEIVNSKFREIMS